MKHLNIMNDMHTKVIKGLCLLGLSVILLITFSGKAHAAATSYQYLSPACGPIYNGGTLSFDIREDSGLTQTNTVQSDLTYSTAQFNLISVSGGSTISSPFTLVVQNDTSTPGKIKFAAASTVDVTGDQLVARVVLQAKVSTGIGFVSFDNTSAIVDTSDTSLVSSTTTGGAYPQTAAHTCGSLVKSADSPSVFMIADGTKKPIPSSGTFVSQGLNWNLISTMTAADAALPTGTPIAFREGSLVKGSGSTVYVVSVSGGVVSKKPINSVTVFQALGYTSADVLTVTDGELPTTTGSALSSTSIHPAGSLVKDSSGTIYLTRTGSKRYVGSVYVLYTHGYNFSQIKAATSADLALTNAGSLAMRFGTLIKGASTSDIYVSDVVSGIATKHSIKSMTTFNSLGYRTNQILSIPDSNLPSSNSSNL